MIPMFLFRLVKVALLLASLGISLWLVLFILNRGIQFVAKKAGFEVKDFSEWLWSLVPKRKKKEPTQTFCPLCGTKFESDSCLVCGTKRK